MVKTSWTSPSPLWSDYTPQRNRAVFMAPAILRFDNDKFMDEAQGAVQAQPSRLRDFVARAESWRDPVVGLDASRRTSEQPAFKLFQPAQSRFYLVAATLACRLPGLPDHTVKPQLKEAVSFVVRRLENGLEYAWVNAKPEPGWKQATATALNEQEDKLPLFALPFPASKATRKIFAGLIPAGRQHQYATGRDLTDNTATNASGALSPLDYALLELDRKVLLPWLALLKAEDDANKSQIPSDFGPSSNMASVFIVRDFAAYLQANLEPVWNHIDDSEKLTGDGSRSLYRLLLENKFDNHRALSDALKDVEQKKDALDKIIDASEVPASIRYVKLTDHGIAGLVKEDIKLGATDSGEIDLGKSKLEKAVESALREAKLKPAPAVPVPNAAPSDPMNAAQYAIRCVYEKPECGHLLPLMSDLSQPFQLASFFDPDAPMRPAPVALPLDTSPAALSKYPKAVTFSIPKELQKQLQRIKSAKDLMDGKVDPPPDITVGFICSLSIPIITIVAFILLMIMVSLLNIVFFWLPFFRICFPIPKFQAKS